jgi:hypothetical protein
LPNSAILLSKESDYLGYYRCAAGNILTEECDDGLNCEYEVTRSDGSSITVESQGKCSFDSEATSYCTPGYGNNGDMAKHLQNVTLFFLSYFYSFLAL